MTTSSTGRPTLATPALIFAKLLSKHLDQGTRPQNSLRRVVRWTHADFGKKIGTSGQAVGSWCGGKHLPSEKFIHKILDALFGDDRNSEACREFVKAYDNAQRSKSASGKRATSGAALRSTTEKMLKSIGADFINDLHYIGNNLDGIKYFLKKFDGATHVYNTVFTRSEGLWGDMWKLDLMSGFLKKVRRYLKNKCKWEDIVIKKDVDIVLKFYKELTEEERQWYEARELPDVDLPLLQCLVAKYEGDRGKVLCGWSFSGGQHARVYYSDEKDTVLYFREYCKMLFDRGHELFPFPPASGSRASLTAAGEEPAAAGSSGGPDTKSSDENVGDLS